MIKLCKRCGITLFEKGKSFCKVCAKLNIKESWDRANKRKQDRAKELGCCVYCPEPRFKGKLCKYHVSLNEKQTILRKDKVKKHDVFVEIVEELVDALLSVPGGHMLHTELINRALEIVRER